MRETLAALKKLEPKLQRSARKQMRDAVGPLQSLARSKLADQPLSGWKYGRYAYDHSSASAGVKVRVGGAASARRSVWPLVTMTQTNAGGAVFDIAGRRSQGNSPQGRAFIAGLNRYGQASRSMWAAAEEGIEDVRENVLKAIDEASRQVNADMRRGI